AQRAKLESPALTPSARVLAQMEKHGNSFSGFGMVQSMKHAENFRARAPSAQEHQRHAELAARSVREQARMEAEGSDDFDAFLTDYGTRTPTMLCD
ncbi:MAG: glutamate--cysteine ligase, partial [Janthinobacterium lividum]